MKVMLFVLMTLSLQSCSSIRQDCIRIQYFGIQDAFHFTFLIMSSKDCECFEEEMLFPEDLCKKIVVSDNELRAIHDKLRMLSLGKIKQELKWHLGYKFDLLPKQEGTAYFFEDSYDNFKEIILKLDECTNVDLSENILKFVGTPEFYNGQKPSVRPDR